MSEITQFVIAELGKAKAVSNHGWPVEQWAGCDGFKFFGPDRLGHLYAAVTGGPGSYADFPELAFGETGWVYAVPADLLAALALTDDAALGGWARAWSRRMSESGDGDKSPEVLLTLSQDLRRLAIETRGRPVLLWHSLAC